MEKVVVNQGIEGNNLDAGSNQDESDLSVLCNKYDDESLNKEIIEAEEAFQKIKKRLEKLKHGKK